MPVNWTRLLGFIGLTCCAVYSEATGAGEQSTKLSEKATLKFINTTLKPAPTAVKLTIMKLGS